MVLRKCISLGGPIQRYDDSDLTRVHLQDYRLIAHGFLAGVPMPQSGQDVLTVAVTERRSREEIDRFVSAMGEVLAS